MATFIYVTSHIYPKGNHFDQGFLCGVNVKKTAPYPYKVGALGNCFVGQGRSLALDRARVKSQDEITKPAPELSVTIEHS